MSALLEHVAAAVVYVGSFSLNDLSLLTIWPFLIRDYHKSIWTLLTKSAVLFFIHQDPLHSSNKEFPNL